MWKSFFNNHQQDSQFKKNTPLDERIKILKKFIKEQKGDQHVLIIVENKIRPIVKMVAQKNLRIQRLYQTIRKIIFRQNSQKSQTKSIFIFAKNKLLPIFSTFGQIYEEYKDKEDGILYLRYEITSDLPQCQII